MDKSHKKKVFEKLYDCVLPVVLGDKFWPKTNLGDVDPPIPRKLSDRQRKNRVREEGEKIGTNISRKGRKMRCKICFKLDHNSRTCPEKGKHNKSNVQSGKNSMNQEECKVKQQYKLKNQLRYEANITAPSESIIRASIKANVTDLAESNLTATIPATTASSAQAKSRKQKEKVIDKTLIVGPRGKQILEGYGL
ncbi:hypothetical protein PTKIN_Ptkin15bG0066400 [Pterospermum kingtungense]